MLINHYAFPGVVEVGKDLIVFMAKPSKFLNDLGNHLEFIQGSVLE